ncbi:SurA N-terminal domain-containing protein [Cellulomonas palmilytica]|uniref:SurA N-terminal domain-containing protein n=1 Tax=Cellulomonas palmilytica TaxID=2608402 RepID=UPI001F43A057|nr:SurA N-terminal domain-containing protein [Cellulomonas palmilytica]UJP41156.1 hypothetical protein F1D97_06835 [Cellulomonas palmilytica]
MTRARAVLLAGGAVLAALLGACSGTPGAAAVVDGRVITADQVQSATDQLTELGQQFDVPTVLSILIQEPTMTRFAADEGVAVSDEDAVGLLDQVSQSVGIDVGEYSPATIAIARYSLASGNLQDTGDLEALGQEVAERLGSLDVEVNPRFGTLGETAAVEGAAARPWIVTPEADAS